MNCDCIALKLKDVIVLTEKFYAKRIKELSLPILKNHLPLFYFLSDAERPLAFTEIFNSWEISKSSLSEVINKYHRLGFIEKIDSVEDKRSFSIALTEKGKELRNILAELEYELMTKFYSNFSTDLKVNFEKNVDQVIENLSEI